jgi:hypothetical protein
MLIAGKLHEKMEEKIVEFHDTIYYRVVMKVKKMS